MDQKPFDPNDPKKSNQKKTFPISERLRKEIDALRAHIKRVEERRQKDPEASAGFQEGDEEALAIWREELAELEERLKQHQNFKQTKEIEKQGLIEELNLRKEKLRKFEKERKEKEDKLYEGIGELKKLEEDNLNNKNSLEILRVRMENGTLRHEIEQLGFYITQKQKNIEMLEEEVSQLNLE